MSRVGVPRLLELGGGLSDREQAMVRDLSRLRLASHDQLARLLDASDSATSDVSAARTARRILARLTADGVLARLERRIGGLRAGSMGYLYYLGPAGQRLVAYWNGEGLTRGRFRPEPGGRYVRHRLAVSELFVEAHQAARRGEVELLAFEVEPACWRRSLDGLGATTVLKPDAYVRLGAGAYEDSAFLEVDLGTESRPVIARKLRAYLDYHRTGAEQAERGVFPRVLLLTNTEARKAALVDLCTKLPPESWQLFTVTTLNRGLSVMAEQLADDAHAGSEL